MTPPSDGLHLPIEDCHAKLCKAVCCLWSGKECLWKTYYNNTTCKLSENHKQWILQQQQQAKSKAR